MHPQSGPRVRLPHDCAGPLAAGVSPRQSALLLSGTQSLKVRSVPFCDEKTFYREIGYAKCYARSVSCEHVVIRRGVDSGV